MHWALAARAKRIYRLACWAEVMGQKPDKVPEGPLYLELTFHPPDGRSYDRDNLVARMKAGIDGMADALKINDRQFTTLAVRLAIPTIGGMVRARITKDSEE